MVLLKNKKGQAAIEFLMTYGWMLLVVLIVGALIFSFVDFGALLPNQLDLNNNLRADATQMVASASKENVQVVFTYLGSKSSSIDVTKVKVTSDIGFNCSDSYTGYKLENLDTNAVANASTNTVSFINGQLGLLTLKCEPNKLINGDTLDGEVIIPVKNIRTGLVVTSRGRLRLTVDE